MSDEQPAVQDAGREYARAMRKCTPKQRKWLRALSSNDWQPWGTALKLGYGLASVHRWLRDAQVLHALRLSGGERIEEARSVQAQAQVLGRYDHLATPRDMGVIHDEKGKVKPLKEWPVEIRSLISEIEYNDDGSIKKVKFINERKGANDAIAKFQHLVVDRTELTGPGGIPLSPPVIHIVERADSD